MLTDISKNNIKDILSDIEANLALLGQYYGLEFQLSKKKFTVATISFSVEASIKDSPKVEAEKNRKLTMLGLPKDTIGSKLNVKGRIYTVSHIDLKKRAYPIIVKDDSGKTYKISVSMYNANRI